MFKKVSTSGQGILSPSVEEDTLTSMLCVPTQKKKKKKLLLLNAIDFTGGMLVRKREQNMMFNHRLSSSDGLTQGVGSNGLCYYLRFDLRSTQMKHGFEFYVSQEDYGRQSST